MTIRKHALLSVLALSLLYPASAQAEESGPADIPAAEAGSHAAGTAQPSPDILNGQPSQTVSAPISIYLDGSPLQPEITPVNLNGTLLVPMRRLFETQGAKLSWNNADKTVTATKDNTTLTYRIGDQAATVNDRTVQLNTPGQIQDGYTLVPLRFVSEALGSVVTWDQAARTVQIQTITFETSIRFGVNLRSSPDSEGESGILQLLPTGAKIHVVREVDAFWLEVRTQNNQTGYISAKPKYTDYTSQPLADKQADELIAYGETFLGTPYVFGASPDQTGSFDCSSFVKRVFLDTLAVDLPRVSSDQGKAGVEVGMDELRKGDLLFFNTGDLAIGHVAIYAGDNQLLHTYSEKYGVRIEAFSDYWKKRFVTARRVF